MRRLFFIVLSLSLLLVAASPSGGTANCVGIDWPVSGPVIGPFAPSGRYAGHWGIDIAATPGTAARAAAPGRVTFSGTVVDNLTVTIDHGGGLKTSYSYLDDRAVSAGTWVLAGATVGTTGTPHEIDALHFSVRVDGDYVDPGRWLVCQRYEPVRALRLVD